MMQCELVSESQILVRIADSIDPRNVSRISALRHQIAEKLGDAIIDEIPSYTTLLLRFDPVQISPFDVLASLEKLNDLAGGENSQTAPVIELPVYYHQSVAPDLESVAKAAGLSEQQVIDLHSSTSYQVYALGFAPGFAFAGSVNPKLQLPRKGTPANVAAGSVAIAGEQTAVYPINTPGGWHVIGRCPLKLFDAQATPPNRLKAGDKVRFYPIDKATFIKLGGRLDD